MAKRHVEGKGMKLRLPVVLSIRHHLVDAGVMWLALSFVVLGSAETPVLSSEYKAVRTLSIGSDLSLPGAGEEFSVSVMIDDASDLVGYRIQVLFPELQLTPLRAENGLLAQAWGNPIFKLDLGSVILVNAGASALSGSGELARIVFTVLPGASNGTLAFGSLTELNDGAIAHTTVDGGFSSDGGEGEGDGEGEGEVGCGCCAGMDACPIPGVSGCFIHSVIIFAE